MYADFGQGSKLYDHEHDGDDEDVQHGEFGYFAECVLPLYEAAR